MNVRFRIFLFFALSLCLISCDQATKGLARQHLQFSQPVSYLRGMVRLVYAENTGAALSLGAGMPQPYRFLLLGLLPLVVLLVAAIVVLLRVRRMTVFQVCSFALIFAGGLGNLIDRLFNDSRVTDWMILGAGSLRTGIFNIADVCVTAGVIGVFIAIRRDRRNAQEPGS